MLNLDEYTPAEDIVKKEALDMEDILEKEVVKEEMEVSKHLRKILEAKVCEIYRTVWAWKEKKKEEEKQNAYLRDLLIKQNIKEREDLEDAVQEKGEKLKKLLQNCVSGNEEDSKEKLSPTF